MKKKINCLFGLLLFTLCMPRVNALGVDIGTQVANSSSTDKSLYEIKVSLKNITDTSYGVASCSMRIQLDGDIQLNTAVRTLAGWTMTVGNIYLFDTGNPALENTDFMVIPVKVGSAGTVNIDNIECSDGSTSVFISNKSINLTYTPEQSNNNNNVNNNTTNNNNNNGNKTDGSKDNNKENVNSTVKDSNCNLLDIVLSEGVIEFDPNVTEYNITVSDFSKLEVQPKLASDKSTVKVEKNEDNITIMVTAEDTSFKIYTLFVEESDVKTENGKTSYVPIFIAIIAVLVIINIFRIVKNSQKKKSLD